MYQIVPGLKLVRELEVSLEVSLTQHPATNATVEMSVPHLSSVSDTPAFGHSGNRKQKLCLSGSAKVPGIGE